MKTWTIAAVALAALAACNQTMAPEGDHVVPAAQSSCLAAVTKQTNIANVSMATITPNDTGSTVMVRVPGSNGQWKCEADTAGAVKSLTYVE